MSAEPTNLHRIRNEFRALSRQSNDRGFKTHCGIVRTAIKQLQAAKTDADRTELERVVIDKMKELRDYLVLTSRQQLGEGQC